MPGGFWPANWCWLEPSTFQNLNSRLGSGALRQFSVPWGSLQFLCVCGPCMCVQFPATSFQLHTGLHFSEAAKNLLVPVFPTVVRVVSDTVRLLEILTVIWHLLMDERALARGIAFSCGMLWWFLSLGLLEIRILRVLDVDDSCIPHRIHVWYIYTNIGGTLMVNVTIYTIHGSYGYWCWCSWPFQIFTCLNSSRATWQSLAPSWSPSDEGGSQDEGCNKKWSFCASEQM